MIPQDKNHGRWNSSYHVKESYFYVCIAQGDPYLSHYSEMHEINSLGH